MAQDNALHICESDPRALKLFGTVQSLENAEELADVRHVKAYAIVPNEDRIFDT